MKGVKKHGLKFQAYVYVKRKFISIGLYETEKLAYNAVKEFKRENGLPDNPKLGRPKKQK